MEARKTRKIGSKEFLLTAAAAIIIAIIALIVTGCGGGGGGTATPAVTETTNRPPVFSTATISPNSCSAPCTTNVSMRATDPDGQDVVCYINFGDNSQLGSFPCSESSAVVKSHTFGSAGTFNIVITARDPMAKTISTTIPITVTQNTAVAGNSTPTLSNFGCAPTIVSQNDPVTCNGTATDADVSDTVTCVVDWADGNTESGLVCNAGNITHSYSATGTFAVSMYPTDGKANGTAQNITVTVNTAPSGAPAAPLVSTDIPAIATSTTFALTGTKGNNCTHLFLNGSEIVSNTSTSWNYTATLNEGTNTLNLVCKNNSNQSSPTTTKTIRRDTTAPLVPVLNPVTTPTTTATQSVGGEKTRDCNLWAKIRSGTATMVDDDNTYDDSNQNDTVTWTYSVSLTSGSNSLEFYCKDDAGWTSASVTSSITYSIGGTNPNAPTGSLLVSPNTVGINTTVTATYSHSSDCTSAIISWGDNSTNYSDANCSGTSATHQYTAYASNTVTLTLTGAGGSNQYTQVVSVESGGGSGPQASFSITPVSATGTTTTTFTYLYSCTSNCTNIICTLSFGDGGANYTDALCNDNAPTHSYGSAGIYSAQLTITGSAGTNIYTKSVTIQ